MSFLQKLRSKSEEEKKIILIISTIVVMAFVLLLWFYLSNVMPVRYTSVESQSNASAIDMLGDFVVDIQGDLERFEN